MQYWIPKCNLVTRVNLQFMDKKEEILSEIKRVANIIAPEQLTLSYFKKESKIPSSRIRYNFGSFNNAVEAAGLKPNPAYTPPQKELLSDEELLKEIGELWIKLGKKPTESLMNANGKFSVRPY
jgi:hypothetical protein